MNTNDISYCLKYNGLTETAVFSKKFDKKHKVTVKNTSEPFDELIVNAWFTNDESGISFVFEDGQLGNTVSLDLKELQKEILDSHDN